MGYGQQLPCRVHLLPTYFPAFPTAQEKAELSHSKPTYMKKSPSVLTEHLRRNHLPRKQDGRAHFRKGLTTELFQALNVLTT